jgi:uncharacterized oxidoreductase
MERIDADELERFATGLLGGLGAPDGIAADVAASLTLADVRGHTSHGVLRIPKYAEMIADGALDPTARPAVDHPRPALAAIEGHTAFGQTVGRAAVDALAEGVGAAGVATVGIREAGHLGRIGEWAERVADEGYLFAAWVNTGGGAPSVAPAGTAQRRLATNPVTYAVPTFDALDYPIVVDVATSQVAHGKLFQYEAAGRELPEGWVVGPDGEPLTDPTAALEDGAIRPLGGRVSGYKGTGLAVVAELFAGIAGNAPVMGGIDRPWFSNAAAFVAIDPLAFASRAGIEERVATVAEHVGGTPAHPAVPVGDAAGDEPLLPGEAEHRATERRRAEGVPLPGRVRESLATMAADLGVEETVPAALRADADGDG